MSIEGKSELTTSDAGNGGNGAAGQAGQSEVGFGGVMAPGACPGGNGGNGSAGSAGGGGAGGVSVAVVWKGAASPVVDSAATVTLGKLGTKGVGGKAGSNDGVSGASDKTLEVK